MIYLKLKYQQLNQRKEPFIIVGDNCYIADVLNASWDGKANNGENCPDATYFYIIKVIDKKDKEHIVPGYVLIAR
ncbi:MAG: gliding motility-associated C-terminal domain-containing protein [Bacteroidetes bacterium]|nr:gliding motility-associated C-terminal domain-containing protein [Bacteroidota bacterium]